MGWLHWLGVAILIATILAGWLVYQSLVAPARRILNVYIANNDEELAYFRAHILERLRAHSNVMWYLGKFSAGTVTTLDTNSVWVPAAAPEMWFKRVFSGNKFDGLVYSGHSGGPYLGNEDDPMIRLDVFVRVLRATTRELAFIWFDSCNMGFLQSLVLLNGVARYVVGAPNYYDWQSVLQTREIYHLSSGDASELISVIRSQASKYDGDAEVLVELCVYMPSKLNSLWLLYKQNRRRLVHDANSRIEDDYFDVQGIIDSSRGRVDDGTLDRMQDALNQGLVARGRCDSCAVEVRDSYLAVQKNRDTDGSELI